MIVHVEGAWMEAEQCKALQHFATGQPFHARVISPRDERAGKGQRKMEGKREGGGEMEAGIA